MKFVLWQWAELFRMVIWEVALANFHKAWFSGNDRWNWDSDFFFFFFWLCLFTNKGG